MLEAHLNGPGGCVSFAMKMAGRFFLTKTVLISSLANICLKQRSACQHLREGYLRKRGPECWSATGTPAKCAVSPLATLIRYREAVQ